MTPSNTRAEKTALALPARLQKLFADALRKYKDDFMAGRIECRIDQTGQYRKLLDKGIRLSESGRFKQAIEAFSESWKKHNGFKNLAALQNSGMQYAGLVDQALNQGVSSNTIKEASHHLDLAEKLFVQALVHAEIARLSFKADTCRSATGEALYGLALTQKCRALLLWLTDETRRSDALSFMKDSRRCLEEALRQKQEPAFRAALDWTIGAIAEMH